MTTVIMKTNKGDITLALDESAAPVTVRVTHNAKQQDTPVFPASVPLYYMEKEEYVK